MKHVFVSWVRFQRRTETMQSFFDYRVKYFGYRGRSRFMRPLEYVAKMAATLRFLLLERPDVVWIQLAPTPLVYVSALYAMVRPGVRVVADCHTSALFSPWVDIPGFVALLRRVSVVLVHNNWMAQHARRLGIPVDRIRVLEDLPVVPPPRVRGTPTSSSKRARPYAVCPCSFDIDEPIAAILEAARNTPELDLVITGDTQRAKGRHSLSDAPPNVRFTGYLGQSDYDAILREADFLVALTLWEGTQLSAANEALGAHLPVVLSDTSVSHELFASGSVYVDPRSPVSIADGLRNAIIHQDSLRNDSAQWEERRTAMWHAHAADVAALLTEEQKGSANAGLA